MRKLVHTSLTGIALLMTLSACPFDREAEVGTPDPDPLPDAGPGPAVDTPDAQPAAGGFEMGGTQPAAGGFEMGGTQPASGGFEMGGSQPASGGFEMGGTQPASGGFEMGGSQPASGGFEMGGTQPASGGAEMGGAEPPPSPELCGDGLDNDGNGLVDENCDPAQPGLPCAADADCPESPNCGPAVCLDGECVDACQMPPGGEICGDGLDNDGNGLIDDNCDPAQPGQDADGDGFPAELDCNDQDPTISPAAPEMCNGIDDDCNGLPDDNCQP